METKNEKLLEVGVKHTRTQFFQESNLKTKKANKRLTYRLRNY
jgi:hypothetical protein